jgi:hypothetical protein
VSPAPPAHLTNGLRENLIGLLEGRAASRQIQAVVNLAAAIALEYLTRRRGAWRLQERLGLPAADLAYDCIADLFERDASGRYRQLAAYFEATDVRACAPEELLILLRRLVYSRTANGMFRAFSEADPAFSRILRNVKLALQALPQFEERERFGDVHLAPLLCATLEHLPLFEPAELEAALAAECTGAENVPDMMAKIALLLRRQEDRSRLVPLMHVAAAIRGVYDSKNRPLLATPAASDTPVDETPELISTACAQVKADMRRSYRDRKRIPAEVYETYFAVVADSLRERVHGGNGNAASYFDLLRVYLPGITPEGYRTEHRSRIEYLGSLVQERLRGLVRG